MEATHQGQLLQFFGEVRGSHLHFGDNLAVLKERIPTGSVDLVYLDPPFNSKRTYNAFFKTPENKIPTESVLAFEDTWFWDASVEVALSELKDSASAAARRALEGLETILGRSDLLAYLVMMAPRLVEMRRVLKRTGSIYLHCDQHASHYLKVLMDSIFGGECFLNNVVWLYGLGGSSSRYWPRKHDDILWYAREPDQQFFEASQIPATSNRMKGQMKKATDYWDIPSLNNKAKERLGYPTQKPEKLLERIIESSCPPGGLVLDPFCGCGTTVAVAERLGRRWIGIDVSPVAVEVIAQRLDSPNASKYRLFGQPALAIEAVRAADQGALALSGFIAEQLGGAAEQTATGDSAVRFGDDVVVVTDRVGDALVDDVALMTTHATVTVIPLSRVREARTRFAHNEVSRSVRVIGVSELFSAPNIRRWLPRSQASDDGAKRLSWLDEMSDLGDGWMDDGSIAPTKVAIDRAREIVLQLDGWGIDLPLLAPTAAGLVQMEWHQAGEVSVATIGADGTWRWLLGEQNARIFEPLQSAAGAPSSGVYAA